MKRLLAVLLMLSICLGLCACGGDKGGSIADADPNLGKYIGIQGEMDGIVLTMEELYPGDSYLELKKGGKAALVLEGDCIDGTWTLDGEEFNLVVEDQDCPGTLKNGTVIFDFAGSGIILTFSKEGAKAPSGGDADQGGSSENEPGPGASGTLGLYQGTTYEYSGQSFQMTDIYDGLCTIELLDDGKAVFILGGEEMQCTWELDGEDFILDNQAVESPGTLADGVITIDFMGMGMMMTFVQGGGTAQNPGGDEGSTETQDPGSPTFPDSFIRMHEGDWHGMAVVYDGTGYYEDEKDMEFEIIARLAFREDGTCEPYLACAFGGEDNNFKNLTATYNETYDNMLLYGEFVNLDLVSESNLFVLDDMLYVDVFVDDGEGNYLNLYACLRRLDEEWDYENDWPCLPEDAVAFYNGKDFLEIAELFQVDVDEIPELESQSGGQDEETTESAASGAGILDYDTIAEVYDWVLFYSSKENGYGKAPYEEIVERMGGVEGAPSDENLWNEKTRFYKWGISEEEFIKLTFQLKDGVWVHCGSTNTGAFMDIYKQHYG